MTAAPIIIAVAAVGATIIALRKGGTAAAELGLAAVVAAGLVAGFLALYWIVSNHTAHALARRYQIAGSRRLTVSTGTIRSALLLLAIAGLVLLSVIGGHA